MNREQVIGLLRHLLPVIGGMATARGWITQEGWTILSEQLLQIAGPAITIAGLVWSYFDKTDAAIVAKAIALPDVAKIECCDTKEGIDLAMSVPHKDVVAEVHPDAAVKGSWVEARCSSISEEEVNL